MLLYGQYIGYGTGITKLGQDQRVGKMLAALAALWVSCARTLSPLL